MDCRIETGQTKSAKDLTLIAETLKTNQGESVIALLHVHGTTQDAKTLQKEYVGIIEHALLETDGDPEVRLDGTLKEVNGLFKGLLLSNTLDDVHAILAIVGNDDVVYVSHAGRAEAYIVRGGAASQITEFTKGKSVPAFVHIASGPVEERDVLVFSTQRLLRTVTPAQLAQLSQRGDQLLDELRLELEAEKEKSALSVLHVTPGKPSKAPAKKAIDISDDEDEASAPKPVKEDPEPTQETEEVEESPRRKRVASRRNRGGGRFNFSLSLDSFSGLFSKLKGVGAGVKLPKRDRSAKTAARGGGSSLMTMIKEVPGKLIDDLKDPSRRRKAHLLILAAVIVLFLIVWAGTKLTVRTQSSQSKGELKTIIEQVDADIKTAENRYLTGDTESANAMLTRAELQAKQVLGNESGYFREESLGLLDQIRTKREEINNIKRISPRVLASLEAKNPNIQAQGMIGKGDGDLTVFDKKSLYNVVLNSVDEPDVLSEEDIIVHGENFERYQTRLFQMKNGSVIELINGQPTTMKTDDPAGWIMGSAVQTYLRFLYVLSPENNQIYKYERLSNRYGSPSEYNVNGDLDGALDLAIDGNIYVLKSGGNIVKLLRGEVQPFGIRHLPEGAINGATRIFKVFDGKMYILDPEGARIVIATDGGASGEAAYEKQIILEGDQLGTLKDLYVDPEELRLYVLDDKRVYTVDLEAR